MEIMIIFTIISSKYKKWRTNHYTRMPSTRIRKIFIWEFHLLNCVILGVIYDKIVRIWALTNSSCKDIYFAIEYFATLTPSSQISVILYYFLPYQRHLFITFYQTLEIYSMNIAKQIIVTILAAWYNIHSSSY